MCSGPKAVGGGLSVTSFRSLSVFVAAVGVLTLFGIAACGGPGAQPPLQQKTTPEEESDLLWRKAAQGDAEAQRRLGDKYRLGLGEPQSHAQAVVWYRRAAEQGLAGAQYHLGAAYQDGHGVPQDYFQAAVWYRHAAEQGLAEAQHSLGVCYERGKGVPEDKAQAVAWYRLAAEQGLPVAQFALGSCYKYGKGIPQDNVEAHKWFNLATVAAAREFGETQRQDVAERRDALARDMTPAQIAEAQKRARDWMEAFEKRSR